MIGCRQWRSSSVKSVSVSAITTSGGNLRIPTEWLWVVAVDELACPLHFHHNLKNSARSISICHDGNSHDGFSAQEFDRRCDTRANALTLRSDMNGNVFGGFASMKWEFSIKLKGNDSWWCFLFMLRNTDSVVRRTFVLKVEKKQSAICCDSIDRPSFLDHVTVLTSSQQGWQTDHEPIVSVEKSRALKSIIPN
jgi:hypothetical protein